MTATSDVGRKLAGTNLEYAKVHNRRVVLQLVQQAGSLTRAEIARRTALTQQTISNIVEELERAHLLLPGVPVRNLRGQPATPYRINPNGGFSLGFHIHAYAIIGVLTNLIGDLVATREVAIVRSTPQAVTPIVIAMMDTMLREVGLEPASVLGVGIALPARFGLGTISTAGPTGLPDWNAPEVRAEFTAQLGLPAFIENDAIAAAIHERQHGIARDIENFVLIFLGDGLGAGLFLNGQPFKGALRNAGEIGHMIIDPNGRICPCGNRGCLERYVSLRAAYEALSPDADVETPDSLQNRLITDPHAVQDWLNKDAGPRLAIAINILETLMDPETIIVAGMASAALIDGLIASATPLPVSVAARSGRSLPRLIAGSTGRTATAQGAAALPIFEEMNPRFEALLKSG